MSRLFVKDVALYNSATLLVQQFETLQVSNRAESRQVTVQLPSLTLKIKITVIQRPCLANCLDMAGQGLGLMLVC